MSLVISLLVSRAHCRSLRWPGKSLVNGRSNVIEGDCSNYRNKSLYGFRMTTLLAWLLGDTYKSVHVYYRQLLPHTHLLYNQVLVFLLSRFPAAVQGLFRLPVIN